MTDVFLHIGLPKSGTTSIQAHLERRIETLSEHGILFPGGWHHAQRLAAYDLLGQRVKGARGFVVPGSFARLMEEVDEFSGKAVVISEETLGLARRRHVRRIVRALRAHQVYVVVTVRDIARTLVSAWQQTVVMGGTMRWQDFMDALRDVDERGVSTAVGFWVRHDLFRLLETWQPYVGAEHIRIVTVPQPPASSLLLMERFAEATGLPPGSWGDEVKPHNVSFGAAEVEVIRRLNEGLAGALNKSQYRHLVEQAIRARLKVDRSRPLTLPAEDLPWAQQHAEETISRLHRAGYAVYGDLDDLRPVPAVAPGRRLDDVSESELLQASEAVLTSLALAHGTLFRRFRAAFVKRKGRPPTPLEAVGSSARAAVFALQRSALEHADSNRLLARAVRAYRRWTG